MKIFKISGCVVSSKTKRGIKGLRVEAWDKDLIVSDLVGWAITAEDGGFRMQFDESYFKELFLDRQPDLFFKVFKGEKLIKSTEDSVAWNVDREDVQVTIETDEGTNSWTQNTKMDKQMASRTLLQATYTPRQPRPGENPARAPRALEKGAFFAHLSARQEELGELASRYSKESNQPDADEKAAIEKALGVVEILINAISPTGKMNVLYSAKQLAGVEVNILVRVAQDLIKLRQETLTNALRGHRKILEEFTKTHSSDTELKTIPYDQTLDLKTLMNWAIQNKIRSESATKTLELAKTLCFDLQTLKAAQFGIVATHQIERLSNLLSVFKEAMETEPVGYLHLERMSFKPTGIERGELVYSVPLSPGEEVNIKHREWSHTSEEFERIVTDYLEEFSEEGVTEKSELAESVNSQTQHSTAFNTGVTASGSYGPVSITATVGYNASDSSSRSEQLSRNQSTDITHKSSSRAKKEHKVSFRVASAAETEDQTIQRIKNPFSDRATRVDYYQLIRKWQVGLYRYGIRLTWDIAIPEPGAGLLSKIREINEIRTQLEEEFEFQVALEKTEDTPDDYVILDDKNYASVAARYGAMVDSPPCRQDETGAYKTEDWSAEPNEVWDRVRAFTIEVEVPNDCVVRGIYPLVHCQGVQWPWWLSIYAGVGSGGRLYRYMPPEQGHYDPENPYSAQTPYTKWNGRSGQLAFLIITRRVAWFHAEIRVQLERSEPSYQAWRLKAFKAIRDAAQTQYYENRQKMNEKLSRLQEELGAQDALSLRKKEREEVMKGVLETLGFPPEDLRENPEIIKFLHHAIEWENVLYFLYPYFWSDPQKEGGNYWEFKKYLDHPDPMHRVFLKAGYARVVLTVRTGFENRFLAFVNKVEFDELPPAPYLEIGKEYEAYAKTSYPGIPPANPIDNFRPLLTPMQKKAWERMRLLICLLEVFYRTNRRYPSTNEGLTALREVFPMKDPWGNDYVYTYPGHHGDFDLVSYGADGVPGGDGENADITNWDSTSFREFPEQVQAWEDMQLVMKLLDEYYNIHGKYPATQEGLVELKPLIPMRDPWSNDYLFTYPGINGEYDLISYGADGEPGGEGEDADITSWAEASLIGQWYEYTPTSALDIAFNETLPSA